MSSNTAGYGASHALDPLGIFGGLTSAVLGPTDAEKQAAAQQQQALQNAQDQLSFNKGVYNANQGTVDSALKAIFGNNPLPDTSLTAAQVGSGTGGPGYPVPGPGANYPTAPAPLGNSATGFSDSEGNVISGNGALPADAQANILRQQGLNPDGTLLGSSPDVGATSSALTLGGMPQRRAPLSFFTPQSQATHMAVGNTPSAQQGGLAGGYGVAENTEGNAAQQLANALNGIKDPTLSPYVGDVTSQANVSDTARNAQTSALGSLQGMTGIQETAAERLQREMARRQMENQMKGDREAMAQNLKSRGVYGAGSELSKQLLTQQEAASRRALEEAQANAGAQARAISAIQGLGNLGTSMGSQDIQAGQAHDVVNQANQSLKEAHNLNQVKTQQQNNTAQGARAATIANAQNNVAGGQRTDTNNLINTILQGSAQKTGTATSGAGLVNNGYQDLTTGLKGNSAFILANDPTTKDQGIL